MVGKEQVTQSDRSELPRAGANPLPEDFCPREVALPK
jgi:hypothetical protein